MIRSMVCWTEKFNSADGKDSLRKAIHEFVAHYHGERNHQGLGNRLIMQDASLACNVGAILRRERLGGMLNYYYRQAA